MRTATFEISGTDADGGRDWGYNVSICEDARGRIDILLDNEIFNPYRELKTEFKSGSDKNDFLKSCFNLIIELWLHERNFNLSIKNTGYCSD